MTHFTEIQPTLENYWRSIILFGRNVASYKFALGKTLLELSQKGEETVSLEELSEPFSRHICEHLQIAGKQATSASSRFLDACRKFNSGNIKKQDLLDATATFGFSNVIDAFHVVHDGDIAVRFFQDERKDETKDIRLTVDLYRLAEHYQYRNLPGEVEARWRLSNWPMSFADLLGHFGLRVSSAPHSKTVTANAIGKGDCSQIWTNRASLNWFPAWLSWNLSGCGTPTIYGQAVCISGSMCFCEKWRSDS